MESRVLTYAIDRTNVICAIGSGWDDFALANGGNGCVATQVLGRKILDCFSGVPAVSMYDQVFHRIRKCGEDMTLPFRCDSPEKKRYLRLSIQPDSGQGLLFSSELLAETLYESPVQWLNAKYTGYNSFVNLCSICKAVEFDDNWITISHSLQVHPALENGSRPKVFQTLCPECSRRANRYHSMIAAPVYRPANQSLPLVVVLLKKNDFWRLHITGNNAPLDHPYVVLSPYLWEAESDPVDYLIEHIKETHRLYCTQDEQILLVAYEDATDVFWPLLNEGIATAGLLVNPDHRIPPPTFNACDVSVAMESGIVEPSWLGIQSSPESSQLFPVENIGYSAVQSLHTLLNETASGRWLLSCG